MKPKTIIKAVRQIVEKWEREGYPLQDLIDVDNMATEYRQTTQKCLYKTLKTQI